MNARVALVVGAIILVFGAAVLLGISDDTVETQKPNGTEPGPNESTADPDRSQSAGLTVRAKSTSDVEGIPDRALSGTVHLVPFTEAEGFVEQVTLTERTRGDTVSAGYDLADIPGHVQRGLRQGRAVFDEPPERAVVCYNEEPGDRFRQVLEAGTATVKTGLEGCAVVNTEEQRAVTYDAGMRAIWRCDGHECTTLRGRCPQDTCAGAEIRQRLRTALESKLATTHTSQIALTDSFTYTWNRYDDRRATVRVNLSTTSLTVSKQEEETSELSPEQRFAAQDLIDRFEDHIKDANQAGGTRSIENEHARLNGLQYRLKEGRAMQTTTMKIKHDLINFTRSATENAVSCEDLQPADRCALEQAIITNDTSRCDQAASRNECIIEVGVRQDDTSVCDRVDPDYRDLCFRRFEQAGT